MSCAASSSLELPSANPLNVELPYVPVGLANLPELCGGSSRLKRLNVPIRVLPVWTEPSLVLVAVAVAAPVAAPVAARPCCCAVPSRCAEEPQVIRKKKPKRKPRVIYVSSSTESESDEPEPVVIKKRRKPKPKPKLERQNATICESPEPQSPSIFFV